MIWTLFNPGDTLRDWPAVLGSRVTGAGRYKGSEKDGAGREGTHVNRKTLTVRGDVFHLLPLSILEVTQVFGHIY